MIAASRVRRRLVLVVDVNVLFSGFVGAAGSPPRQIIEMWLSAVVDIVVSPKLLEEARDVFDRPRLQRWVQGRGSVWVEALSRFGIVVDDPDNHRWTVAGDPDDAYLVALAVSADAILVTGDADLMKVEPAPPIRIISARAFVDGLDRWLQTDE